MTRASTEPEPLGSCCAKALPSLPESWGESSPSSVGDGLGDEEDAVGVTTKFELDVGAGGGGSGGGADTLVEEETVEGEFPSEVTTKFGLDVGVDGDVVGILVDGIFVELVLTTTGPGPGAEFIPS